MMEMDFENKTDKVVRSISKLLTLLLFLLVIATECKRSRDYKRVIYNYEDISNGKTELKDENYKMIGEPHREYYTHSPRYIHFWDKYNYRKEDND